MHTTRSHLILLTLLVAAVLALPAPMAVAEDGGHDNIVALHNTTDGSDQFAHRLMVLEEQQGDVDHRNHAEAVGAGALTTALTTIRAIPALG